MEAPLHHLQRDRRPSRAEPLKVELVSFAKLPSRFGDFRIARSFAGTAHAQLAPGGRALFVAKEGAAGDALADVVADTFRDVHRDTHRGYAIVAARR